MQRTVASTLTLEITEPAHLVFAVAVASGYTLGRERFSAELDGIEVPATEITDLHGTRLHAVSAGIGDLIVRYDATVEGTVEVPASTEIDRLTALRPSRYVASDALAATAAAEFGGLTGPEDLLKAVSSWVGTHLRYVPGSSSPTDGALDTLLAREGVCRDYAHLCIAFLRARGVPARLAAVYAPGLSPMDFHAVTEAWVEGAWRVVDATTLAPRATLVRIATGRDAADTAFLNVLSGRVRLVSSDVSAVADDIPTDDLDDLVSIA